MGAFTYFLQGFFNVVATPFSPVKSTSSRKCEKEYDYYIRMFFGNDAKCMHIAVNPHIHSHAHTYFIYLLSIETSNSNNICSKVYQFDVGN